MCGSFIDPKDNRYRPFVPPSDALVDRTRLVESTMQGERVPEAAWQAFFSPACTAIEWAYFERMFAARSAAVAYLAIQSSSRQRRPTASRFRCIAD